MIIDKAIEIIKNYEKEILLNEVESKDVKSNMQDLTLNYVIECAFINHKTNEEIIQKATQILKEG